MAVRSATQTYGEEIMANQRTRISDRRPRLPSVAVDRDTGRIDVIGGTIDVQHADAATLERLSTMFYSLGLFLGERAARGEFTNVVESSGG